MRVQAASICGHAAKAELTSLLLYFTMTSGLLDIWPMLQPVLIVDRRLPHQFDFAQVAMENRATDALPVAGTEATTQF